MLRFITSRLLQPLHSSTLRHLHWMLLLLLPLLHLPLLLLLL